MSNESLKKATFKEDSKTFHAEDGHPQCPEAEVHSLRVSEWWTTGSGCQADGTKQPRGHLVVSEGLARQQRTPRRGLCSQ